MTGGNFSNFAAFLCIMKKLYLYITKSFLGTFVLTFFIVVFIWVMQFVWLYVDDLVGKRIGNQDIGRVVILHLHHRHPHVAALGLAIGLTDVFRQPW